MENLGGTAIVVILFVLYMLPAVIAISRKHQNWLMIVLLDFFLAWTVIIWFVCLIWSFVDSSKQTIIIKENKEKGEKNEIF